MIILRDTREKQPWSFDWYDDVKEIRVCTLKTADYTMAGYEDIISVERKRSTGELAINFGTKRRQFVAELERMQSIKYRYIVCEFPIERLSEFPRNSGIPEKDWKKLRMNGGYIRKTIRDFSTDYNVTFLFCSSPFEAQDEVYKIFQNVIDNG